MNMRFDKAGNGHSPLGIEREGCTPGSVTATDTHDAAVGYFDITKAFASPQGNVLDQDIRCHRQGSVQGAPANVTKRSAMGTIGLIVPLPKQAASAQAGLSFVP